MDYTESAKQTFAKDLFATKLAGVEILSAEEGYARCVMKITPEHMNAAGFVMGGAIYTIADFAFAVASNIANPLTVTLTSTIDFINATKGPELFAEAKAVKNGKGVCFIETTVTDSFGKLVATVKGTGYRVAKTIV